MHPFHWMRWGRLLLPCPSPSSHLPDLPELYKNVGRYAHLQRGLIRASYDKMWVTSRVTKRCLEWQRGGRRAIRPLPLPMGGARGVHGHRCATPVDVAE